MTLVRILRRNCWERTILRIIDVMRRLRIGGVKAAEDTIASFAAVVARAVELVEARIAAGGRSVDAAEARRRRMINADESARLANAIVSPKFLLAMRDFNKRKPSVARFFTVANATLPLWRPVAIKPAYGADS